MKTKVNTRRHLALLALAVAGLLPGLSNAGPPPDLMNSALRSYRDATVTPNRSTVATVCTGCRNDMSMKSVPAGQGTVSLPEFVQACANPRRGTGSCCVPATKPGAGATKGMEKENK